MLDELADRFDDAVETQFKRLRGNKAADRTFYTASALGDFGLIWVVFALLRALRGGRLNERAAVRAIIATGVESVLVNVALKSLIQRHRPADQPDHPHRIRQPLSSSFPSGHATAAFCGATLLADGDPAAAPVYFAAAATIAASRVHTGMHHATDVAGGVLVGLVLGQIGKRLFPLQPRRR